MLNCQSECALVKAVSVFCQVSTRERLCQSRVRNQFVLAVCCSGKQEIVYTVRGEWLSLQVLLRLFVMPIHCPMENEIRSQLLCLCY